MKGTVTRLRLLSLAAVVLVIAASIAVSAAPRRAPHTAAPQPVSVAQVQSTTPAAPVAHVATPARHAAVTQVAAASVAPVVETVVPVRASAGMLIVKDPETGELGLDPSSSMIGNELNDSDEGLVEETLWDGSKMVNLEGRYQEVFVLHVGADGSRWVECSKNPSLTAKPVVAPAPVPQFEER